MATAGISPEHPLRDAFGVNGMSESSYGLILYEDGIWLAQGTHSHTYILRHVKIDGGLLFLQS